MFTKLADLVMHRRRRWAWLAIWPVATVLLVTLWPVTLAEQTTNDQASFMQADASSAVAQRLLEKHFPEVSGARAAVVIHRPDGLTETDLQFMAGSIDRLVADAHASGGSGASLEIERIARPWQPVPPNPLLAWTKWRQWSQRQITNAFLISTDGCVATASLKAGEFFLSKETSDAVVQLREAMADGRPEGLEAFVTGNAGIGRDYTNAIDGGLANTHLWAIIAVVTVLVLVYRSPVAILVPLITIGISVVITLKIVAVFAMSGMKVPSIVEAAVVVIIYGSGTDYCLFLIARFREEMTADPSSAPAAARRAAVATGPAIAASAGTTAAGVALMGLSRMPTLAGCGVAMAVGLVVAMAVSLTFTSALLSIFGRTLFWPMKVKPVDRRKPGKGVWGRVGGFVTKRPGRMLIGSLLALASLGWIVLIMPITYDTPSALAPGDESIVGMQRIGDHFRPGELGPVHVVASMPRSLAADATRVDRWADDLSNRLRKLSTVSDVRGPANPFGVTHETTKAWKAGTHTKLTQIPYAIARTAARVRYVSLAAAGEPRAVVRMEVVLSGRPFSLTALDAMDQIRRIATEAAGSDVQVSFSGATADIADIRDATRVDLPIIGSLVLLAVLGIVFLTLRDFWMSLAMVAATVLTVAATLGATYLIFQSTGASGVDWKVAFILFVLLIAIGVDYNIYLATRIREQRQHQSLRPAVAAAVRRTGGVITSCGVVVAATFAALTATPLLLMIQWGTAMALGILLDTFLVQPIIMPAFCVYFNRLKPRRPQGM